MRYDEVVDLLEEAVITLEGFGAEDADYYRYWLTKARKKEDTNG